MLCIIKLDKFDHSQAQLSLVQSADLWCQVLRINQTRVGLANKPDKCAKTLIAESIACLMMRKQFHKSAGRARWVSWALALAQLSLKLNENGVMDALGADKFLSVSIMSVSSSLGSRGERNRVDFNIQFHRTVPDFTGLTTIRQSEKIQNKKSAQTTECIRSWDCDRVDDVSSHREHIRVFINNWLKKKHPTTLSAKLLKKESQYLVVKYIRNICISKWSEFLSVQPHSQSGQLDAINVIININNMIGHKTENETKTQPSSSGHWIWAESISRSPSSTMGKHRRTNCTQSKIWLFWYARCLRPRSLPHW